MKKKFIISAMVLTLLCTGCGNTKSEDSVYNDYSNYEYTAASQGGFDTNSSNQETYYDYDGEMADEYVSMDSTEAAISEMPSDSDVSQAKKDVTGVVNKEMLVYRGELAIDTLDFDTSVNDFKALVNEKGGFIESESYTDNRSTSGYYAIEESEKRNVYSAMVRIPSSEYDAVINSAGSFGDVRSKSSNATNVTQQYGTYKSQLEIYETEYKRYLALLEEATEDEYALMIENELFDVQLQIASLKSNITNLENDVAYSYIDITIKEVSKYEDAPKKTDTFWDRFKNTCKDSWEGFLEVLEGLLFFIILNIYYIIIIAAIIITIKLVIKKKRKKKTLNYAGTAVQNVKESTIDTAVQNVQDTKTVAENTSEIDKATQGNTVQDKADEARPPQNWK